MILSTFLKKNYDKLPKNFLHYIPIRNIIIEPVGGNCNIDCLSCPANIIKREKGMMKFQDYCYYLTHFKDLKHIGLFFMGEPFLNKEIFEMIKYNKSKNIRTSINTNSTTLYNQYKEIIDSGLDKLVLSLDGFTKETHERYRVGSNFNQIKEGMFKLSTFKKICKSDLEIEVRTLMFKGVEDEIKEIEKYCKFLNFKHRKINPIITGWGGKDNPLGVELKDESYKRNKIKNYCDSIFRVVILWNGYVTMCCNDVHGEVRYGNLKEQSFNEIYYSKQGKKIRNYMYNKMFKQCVNCGNDILE